MVTTWFICFYSLLPEPDFEGEVGGGKTDTSGGQFRVGAVEGYEQKAKPLPVAGTPHGEHIATSD